MGMDIRAKMIYGLPYEEMEELVEDLDDLLDDGELDYASPYYDAPLEDWIVGIEVGNTHLNSDSLSMAVAEARACFERITKEDCGKIYVRPHVY